MVIHTQTIRRQQPTNGLSVVILWGWRLKGKLETLSVFTFYPVQMLVCWKPS